MNHHSLFTLFVALLPVLLLVWFGFSFRVRHIGCHGSIYMTRIEILNGFGFKLMLNYFRQSDWARDLHDHPWWFISLPLWRGYIEEAPLHLTDRLLSTDCSNTPNYYQVIDEMDVRPLRPIYRPIWWRHRVILRDNKPALTLVLTGRKVRSWGFHTIQGWINWRDYTKGQGCTGE